MAIGITDLIVFAILIFPSNPLSDGEVPSIGLDRLETIHRTLTISLTSQEFSNECTRIARKPPNWFLSRREMAKHHLVMNLITKQIFEFNNTEPTVISCSQEGDRLLKINGDDWKLEMSIDANSVFSFQEMGRSDFFIAKRFEDSAVIIGDTDSLVIARVSLTGKLLWDSYLHRISGRTRDVDLEAFVDGHLLTVFSADRRNEELAIEILDLGTNEVKFWWSSAYTK